jgi:hypothetical protein
MVRCFLAVVCWRVKTGRPGEVSPSLFSFFTLLFKNSRVSITQLYIYFLLNERDRRFFLDTDFGVLKRKRQPGILSSFPTRLNAKTL